MSNNKIILALIGLLTCLAVGIPSCGTSEGQTDASHQSDKGQAAAKDILSLDDHLPSTYGPSTETVPALPDDGEAAEDDAGTGRVQRSVIVLVGPSCLPCEKAKQAIKYLERVQPGWADKFDVQDVEADGKELFERLGEPYYPTWVITEEDGTESVYTGWHGGNPESQQAIDWLVSMYGYEPSDYRKSQESGAVGASESRQLEAGDALSRHLRGKGVTGFYNTSVDVDSLIDKVLGGAETIDVSDGLQLSMDGVPRVALAAHGEDVRLTFIRGPPTVTYRKGWFKTSTSVPYIDISNDAAKVTIGLKGLPDFPVYLEW